MKRFLLMMMLMCSMFISANAKKDQIHGTAATTAVTVVSDTTAEASNTDSIDQADIYSSNCANDNDENNDIEYILKNIGPINASMGWIVTVGLFFVLVLLLSPFIIIGVVCYFIFRSKKRNPPMQYYTQPQSMQQEKTDFDAREQVATPSVKSDFDKKYKSREYNKMYSSGMTQTFTGVGLILFFGFLTGWGSGLCGIGVLVMCIGIGRLLSARNYRKNCEDFRDNDDR